MSDFEIVEAGDGSGPIVRHLPPADELLMKLDVPRHIDALEAALRVAVGRCRVKMFVPLYGVSVACTIAPIANKCTACRAARALLDGGDDAQPDKGVTVTCADCGATTLLPFVGPDRVSIDTLDRWTAPPARCPECSGTDRPVSE